MSESQSADGRYVMVPTSLLTALADGAIKPASFTLAVVMLSYVNHKRGDRTIWPSRQALASKMHISKADNIDKYVAELEKAGLIEVRRRQEERTRTKNKYVLTMLATKTKEIPPESGVSIPPEQGASIPPDEGASIPPESGVELKEENQSNKPKRRVASSSARARPDDDDEARTQKIAKRTADRKTREHHAAVQAIATRLDTTVWHADATITYLRELASDRGQTVGNIQRYVAGIPDDELQDHHDTGAWQVDGWLDSARHLCGQLAEFQPTATPADLDEQLAVTMLALRAGYHPDQIADALNAARQRHGSWDIAVCIAAVEALSQQAAA